MTAEDRYIVDLADILSVRIECDTCGASMVISPKAWADVPFSCHGCHKDWHMGTHEKTYQTVNGFRLALGGTIALEATKQIGYRVRFEIERPKA